MYARRTSDNPTAGDIPRKRDHGRGKANVYPMFSIGQGGRGNPQNYHYTSQGGQGIVIPRKTKRKKREGTREVNETGSRGGNPG